MKKLISNKRLISSLKWGFFLGLFLIFIISPVFSDAIDEKSDDSLLAVDLSIEEDTLVKDPATGEQIPFSELKAGNPKLSSSLNQLVSAYQYHGEERVKAFASERGMYLKEDLIQVVIEIHADSHEPLAEEILYELRDRIVQTGGKFELDFHNLLQVWLPVSVLEEVANWTETKFVREPFHPIPLKDNSEDLDQKENNFATSPLQMKMSKASENKIATKDLQKKKCKEDNYRGGGKLDAEKQNTLDNRFCPHKKNEVFSPDPSSYEQISDEEAKGYENSLEEDRYLKGETLVSAQAYSEVWFCLEYNCSSVTVTFGGQTHSSTLKCSNPIGFRNVPDGTYSYYASGCGVNWSGTITVLGGYGYFQTLCPPSYDPDCCPSGSGCGEGGSYLCGQCSGPEKPNLTPYKPSGWSDKIVVSNNSGDHLDDSPLYDTDMLYIDYADINNGTAPTNQTYYTALYIDDVLEVTISTSPPHNSGDVAKFEDYSIATLSPGTHTIKTAVDYDNRIAESNETDNEYTKTITVLHNPDYQSVTSEGVDLIGADKWQDDGYTGEGVKVAIIDLGFENYSSLLGKELPDSVTTNFYGSEDDTVHGTACAEIIHDMAPDAQFFLTQPGTIPELGNAVDWCVGQGVQIISYSASWSINVGPLDGTGYINDIVNQAVNHGITWVNSSGNNAKAHWGGEFYDPDGDGILNFSEIVEINSFETWGQLVTIGMNWDDPWGASANDYNLYVLRLDTLDIVDYSTDVQDGDDYPSEFIRFTPQSGVSYGFRIEKYSGISKKIHVTIGTENPLQYQIPATSICIPADNPNIITVGAVAWNTPSEIEDFSSQGPTTDGRIKPDLVAPDRVSTSDYTYGAYPDGFPGTSASCPHVAGACALVKQAYPGWSPSQIKNYLEQNAIDLGAQGKDNVYGSGLVNLPVNAADWATISGTIQYEGTPLCAMVLANGQYMFTCGDSLGFWNLEVPLDANGEITLYGFCSGLAPFKAILTPGQAQNFDIAMSLAPPDSQEMEVTVQTEAGTINPDYVRISGTVTYEGTPLCTMVLANGQNMFSCGNNLGTFDLEVPLDENGEITLFVFCSGLAPYKEVFIP